MKESNLHKDTLCSDAWELQLLSLGYHVPLSLYAPKEIEVLGSNQRLRYINDRYVIHYTNFKLVPRERFELPTASSVAKCS